MVSKPVTEFDEFTGRFEAVERVEVRPRVSGYIVVASISREGTRSRRATCCSSSIRVPIEAELKRAKARARAARSAVERWRKSERDARGEAAASSTRSRKEEFDSRTSGSEQAARECRRPPRRRSNPPRSTCRSRGCARRSRASSGRAEVTAGNLVTRRPDAAHDGRLDRSDLRRRSTATSRSTSSTRTRTARRAHELAQRRNPVWVGLADEGLPARRRHGVRRQRSSTRATGTIRARALLDNHDRRFTPGLFARVKLVGSAQVRRAAHQRQRGRHGPERASSCSCVGADNKVEYAREARPARRWPARRARGPQGRTT